MFAQVIDQKSSQSQSVLLDVDVEHGSERSLSSLSVGRYDRYLRAFSHVPGWFEEQAVASWDVLLDYQRRSGIRGNLVEIGVWKGKSAAMMALHAREDETCVLVDWSPLQDALTVISDEVPTAKCIGVPLSSDEFRHSKLFASLKGAVRWLHIDGGHSTDQVCRDLEGADSLLADDGIVVVDDCFSAAYPQVTQGVFWTLHMYPGRFALVLVGFNKGYLCRPAAANRYLSFIRDCMHTEMVLRGCGPVTFWKTNRNDELNTFGMLHADSDGYAYRGLDTDHGEIQI